MSGLDVSSLLPLANQAPSVEMTEENELLMKIKKSFDNQLADQNRTSADFHEQVRAGRNRIAQMYEQAGFGGPAVNKNVVTPELLELSKLLNQYPAITGTVLMFAKNLITSLESSMKAQLAAANAVFTPTTPAP